jgi:beta-lactamase regulating signal transducer with metallopeptidase domain
MTAPLLNVITDMPGWALLLSKMTVILVLAWIGHFALASANPRWQVFLWRITGVSLIILTILAVFAPRLVWRMELAPRMVSGRAAAFTRANAPWSQNHLSDMEGDIEDGASRHPALENSVSGTLHNSSGPSTSQTFDLGVSRYVSRAKGLTFIVSVWLAGIFFRGLRFCIGHLRIRRIVRLSCEVPDSIRKECLLVAQAIRCSRVATVLQSDSASSPLVCGMRKSILLLPQRVCRDSYRCERPGIFAHELAHVRSRDIAWNELLEILSIVRRVAFAQDASGCL